MNNSTTLGDIKISWKVANTTGVRLSIDPPSASVAYSYGYADYLGSSGSAELPFACNPPNHDSGGYYHLYVITTLHSSGGAYAYQYRKVYSII